MFVSLACVFGWSDRVKFTDRSISRKIGTLLPGEGIFKTLLRVGGFCINGCWAAYAAIVAAEKLIIPTFVGHSLKASERQPHRSKYWLNTTEQDIGPAGHNCLRRLMQRELGSSKQISCGVQGLVRVPISLRRDGANRDLQKHCCDSAPNGAAT